MKAVLSSRAPVNVRARPGRFCADILNSPFRPRWAAGPARMAASTQAVTRSQLLCGKLGVRGNRRQAPEAGSARDLNPCRQNATVSEPRTVAPQRQRALAWRFPAVANPRATRLSAQAA